MAQTNDNSNSRTRFASLDTFRGFAIIGMVLVNFWGGLNAIPDWLKHASDIGLTFADLVAPFFIFAIGLTYGISARRRMERDGWSKTAGHFFRRWMAIVGIGAIMTALEKAYGSDVNMLDWGALQAIGVAGLLTFPLLSLKKEWRALIGVGLLVVYQILLDNFFLATVLKLQHGGIIGSLGWTGMMILSTVLADFFFGSEKEKRWFPWISLLTLAVGIGLWFIVPVSKHRVSASYVILATGASAVLFWLFHLLNDKLKVKVLLLEMWGRNPLLLYLLQYLVMGVFILPPFPKWNIDAPLWLVLTQSAVLLVVLTLIARFLEKKRWFLTL
jgi:predicted acyltransferase